eukprot:gene9276-19254_t
MTNYSKALLLGMYYSFEEEPKRGQGFRDGVRCSALESLGYEVFTLDDKHKESISVRGRHCQANFSDHHRMLKSIEMTWPDVMNGRAFNTIILDYFFSPAGWVEFRWTPNFFKRTLPFFAEKDLIVEGGHIWLPHVGHVHKMLQIYRRELEDYFIWQIVNDPTRNPLVRATDDVHHLLKLCPDNMTNETQLRPLAEGEPFYILQRIKKSETEKRKLLKSGIEVDINDNSPSVVASGKSQVQVVPGKTTRSGTVFARCYEESSEKLKSKKKTCIWSTTKRISKAQKAVHHSGSKSKIQTKTKVALTTRVSLTLSTTTSSPKSTPKSNKKQIVKSNNISNNNNNNIFVDNVITSKQLRRLLNQTTTATTTTTSGVEVEGGNISNTNKARARGGVGGQSLLIGLAGRGQSSVRILRSDRGRN